MPQPVTSVTGFAMTHYKKCIGRADVGIGPYGSATRGAMGGRPQGSPLRKRYKGCGRRADVGIGPYRGDGMC